MIPTEYYFFVATFVFLCGFVGVFLRRNLIMLMISIELMLNAVNLIFVAASSAFQQFDGHIMALFVMTVAACEAAIGLAMVIAFYRKYGNINTDYLRILRG